MAEEAYAKGLEGVGAAESAIARIDGAAGALSYRGYAIEDQAAHSGFEEVTCLLLYDRLPSPGEFETFSARMRPSRGLAPPILAMIRSFPPAAPPWNSFSPRSPI